MRVLGLVGLFVMMAQPAFAGPNADFMQSHSLRFFEDFEPTYPERHQLEVSYNNGTLNFKKTCLWSETNQGQDTVITLTAPYTIDEYIVTISSSTQQTMTNDKGKICSAFIEAGPHPYTILRGNRQVAVQHKVFDVAH